MGRWEPGTRERLERAALELFLEQGFAETTVPQITARAGLTTRTFFRHFADKREVFFATEGDLPQVVADHVAAADLSRGALHRVLTDLPRIAEQIFGDRHAELLLRRSVVATDPGLVERDLRKRATLTAAIAAALRERGVAPLTAELAGGVGVSVLNAAVTHWLAGPADRPLATVVAEAVQELTSLRSPAG